MFEERLELELLENKSWLKDEPGKLEEWNEDELLELLLNSHKHSSSATELDCVTAISDSVFVYGPSQYRAASVAVVESTV